ncbi:D-alanyl-D-alanine carboxypeptidase/D-alanyl-D-alanine endopeptidase [Streptomyces thermodiastaticus]
MVVREPNAWRAAKPRLTGLARAARPRLARLARAARPVPAGAARSAALRIARLAAAAGTRPAGGPRTWQFTAGAATAGLALAAAVVTAAGPWDSSGQRTAERDRAAALEAAGGADHGVASGTSADGPVPAPSAPPVLASLARPQGGAPRLAGVLDPLLRDPALGDRPAAVAVDLTDGHRLYGRNADAALTPASTTKIATAAAALSALGPDHRFTTRTALEPGTTRLVLVGGGDPTLTARADADGRASLRTLAERTAAALTRRGLHEVTLAYDTSLFAGDGMHPIGVNDNLARVTALAADEGRTDGSTSGPAPREADPAAAAARAFAGFLHDHGIRTGEPAGATATGRAQTLASVSSPPLSDVVERMLTESDNDIAETLARQTALATGERPDFAGGARAITRQLAQLGLPLKGASFHDGSGLDRSDRLTADLLTALLRTAADPARPGLRPVLTGLPVAGFTGTLADRYTGQAAAGIVHAKTGTLTGVNTLAGTVVDRDGRLLAFAFLAEGTTDPQAAQSALDRAATALAGCGCR